MICTPTHSGSVQASFCLSLANTVKALALANVEVAWRVLSFSAFIQAARNKLASDFLASDYTDLVFIDADMGWDTEGLLRMLARDVQVIGAICPKRCDPIDWAVNLLRDTEGRRIERDGLIECAYIGTALLRIRRDALDRMEGRFFDAAYEEGGLIGEDAWFCREFRRRGGRIWAEPDFTVTHTGPKSWIGNFQQSVA